MIETSPHSKWANYNCIRII